MSEFTDYLEEHFTLRPAGATQLQVIGECPFCGHDSADQRMYVNRKTDAGFCHHCGSGFNQVTFVAARERCDRKTARRILHKDSTVNRYVATPDDEEDEAPCETPWPVLEDVFDYPEARAYLNARNVSDDMIRRFQLKYCTRNMDFNGRTYWTRNRVIIPIYRADGVPVGWQGRDITGRSKIKYLFPPCFRASEHLFNITSVNPSLKYVILSEGTFDVFGWSRFGVRNVLGTFGKKISGTQMDALISLGITTILIAWDADAHWERDEFCQNWGHQFNIRIVDLGGKDADESSADELKKALLNARAFAWSQKILACL